MLADEAKACRRVRKDWRVRWSALPADPAEGIGRSGNEAEWPSP
jgi:hypothetical protein